MQLHHCAITVKNLDESINFYTKFFGLQEVKRFSRPDLDGQAVLLKADNINLELWEFNKTIPSDSMEKLLSVGIRHIAFEVDNLEVEVKRLRELDVEVSEPKLGASGAWYAFLNDPSGVPVELYQSDPA